MVYIHAINVVCTRTHTCPDFFNIGHYVNNADLPVLRPIGQQCCPIMSISSLGIFTIANNLSYIVATLLTYLNVHGLFHFCSRLRTNQEQNENNPPMGCVVIVCSVRPFRGIFWKTVDTLFHMVYNSNMKYLLWIPCTLLGAYIGYIIVMMIWGTFNG